MKGVDHVIVEVKDQLVSEGKGGESVVGICRHFHLKKGMVLVGHHALSGCLMSDDGGTRFGEMSIASHMVVVPVGVQDESDRAVVQL